MVERTKRSTDGSDCFLDIHPLYKINKGGDGCVHNITIYVTLFVMYVTFYKFYLSEKQLAVRNTANSQ